MSCSSAAGSRSMTERTVAVCSGRGGKRDMLITSRPVLKRQCFPLGKFVTFSTQSPSVQAAAQSAPTSRPLSASHAPSLGVLRLPLDLLLGGFADRGRARKARPSSSISLAAFGSTAMISGEIFSNAWNSLGSIPVLSTARGE